MMVWVSGKQVNANGQTYHTSLQCDRLTGHGARKVSKATVPNHDQCAICADDDVGRGQNKGQQCPKCGDTHPKLASHLRGCDG